MDSFDRDSILIALIGIFLLLVVSVYFIGIDINKIDQKIDMLEQESERCEWAVLIEV